MTSTNSRIFSIDNSALFLEAGSRAIPTGNTFFTTGSNLGILPLDGCLSVIRVFTTGSY